MTKPTPAPDPIFRAFTAYQDSAALIAACDLSLFTAVGAGMDTVEALARHCDAQPRGIRILCDYLVLGGFLLRDGDRYLLTELAATYLDEREPSYVGGARHFLCSDELRASFAALTDAVRKGGAAYRDGGTTAEANAVWVEFARAMEPMLRPTAIELAEHITGSGLATGRILDVAAGHGRFGLEIAARKPGTTVTGLDWPAVLEVARDNAVAEGVPYECIAGSAFDVDWGNGYDLVLLPNFLHHFDRETCVTALTKARDALADGGAVCVVEIVPDETRLSPPRPAGFALVMLATTPHGDAYTEREYREMFDAAGFPIVKTESLAGGDSTALLAVK